MDSKENYRYIAKAERDASYLNGLIDRVGQILDETVRLSRSVEERRGFFEHVPIMRQVNVSLGLLGYTWHGG